MNTETNETAASEVVVKEVVEMKITAPTDKLNAETRHIAQAANTAITGKIDSNGVGKLDKDVYLTQMLTDGLDEASVRRFTGHHRNAMAGLALGVGEPALQFMQDNPDVNVVRVDIPTVDKDYYSVKVTKQRDVAGTTSYGLVQVSHEMHGGGKEDQLVQVKSIIGNKAREIWSKM